jgi:F-type H+-transporting ATPase subunit delta
VHPAISWERKLPLLEQLAEGKVSEATQNFLRFLLAAQVYRLLPLILQCYQELVFQEEGILRARVKTVVPLPDSTRIRLKQDLERLTNKKIRLEEELDPTIIGGMFIQLGNSILDLSVNRYFTDLGKRLGQ